MNSFTLLPSQCKIRKCPSYFSGLFITLEWHLCLVLFPFGVEFIYARDYMKLCLSN